MVKVQLQGEKETVTINAMVDSGATEDFIDSEVCKKHGIKMIKAKNPREIYLADGKPSAMGPVTHRTEVPMDISNHRESATFQVANLQHHEVILGMPWLQEHNPTIDWKEKKRERLLLEYLQHGFTFSLIHLRQRLLHQLAILVAAGVQHLSQAKRRMPE